MEFLKIKCSKCGYELTIPDSTKSVICGSCGEVNRFSRLSSLLRKHSDSSLEIKWGERFPGADFPSDKGGEIRKPEEERSRGPLSAETRTGKDIPSPEDEEETPEQGRAAKLMTLIFIAAPFIAVAVEHFKLPPYVAVIAIAGIILLLFILKKRS